MTVAIPEDLQPVWVGDSGTREWAVIQPTEYGRRLIEWLRSEGYDEMITYRVEVYILDAPFARIFQYVCGEDGGIQLNESGDDVLTTMTTTLLSSLPPQKESA